MTAAGRCIFYFYNMISGSKVRSRSCLHDRLEPRLVKHEKVAIYVVNQRISNVELQARVRKIFDSGLLYMEEKDE